MPKLIPDFFREGQDAYARGLSLEVLVNRTIELETETRTAWDAAYAGGDEAVIKHAEHMAENAIPSIVLGFLDGLVASIRHSNRADSAAVKA